MKKETYERARSILQQLSSAKNLCDVLGGSSNVRNIRISYVFREEETGHETNRSQVLDDDTCALLADTVRLQIAKLEMRFSDIGRGEDEL